jgi:hypothetical protein
MILSVEWHRGHHNALAKMIREVFPMPEPTDEPQQRIQNNSARAVLSLLALDAARRFKEADESFDHLAWLDQCSPDPESLPFSELWEDYINES